MLHTRGSCSPRKDHSVQYCYTTWKQNLFSSQLFGAAPAFELFLDNTEHSGVLATNLDHKTHTENTSNNQKLCWPESTTALFKIHWGYFLWLMCVNATFKAFHSFESKDVSKFTFSQSVLLMEIKPARMLIVDMQLSWDNKAGKKSYKDLKHLSC